MADFKRYPDRRKFSDAVHSNIAPKVYQYLGWELDNVRDEDYRRNADLTDGIDYYILVGGHHRTVQERFRRQSYARYNDITFRYTYPDNTEDRKNSEWFKITADYMIYGIADTDTKDAEQITRNNRFVKLAVIDLRRFSLLVDEGKIAVGNSRQSEFRNGILIGGLQRNKKYAGDNPSTFAVFDVRDLFKVNSDLIILEKGYGTSKDLTGKDIDF
ncbi:MAG: hypothetical protein PUC44_00250 [Eubacteriales bacterium]|nr:hypothetical protein [Eubacteriales bacterium]